ncbi:MAG: MATE family efflux transporter [Chitinophagaceae bacterium]|nr:MATE family efflux transporter [Chitinophagaceae bacterium]
MSQVLDTSLQVKITNRQILQIALPISVALIIPNINFITNNIFLGGLGERALANAGTVGVYYLIMMVSGSGLSNALQALISRRGGEGSINAIHTLFAQGIRIALQFALAGMLITWFVAPICLKPFIKPENFEMEMNFLRIRIWGLPFLYLFQTGNAFLIGTLNSRYMMIGTIAEALINIFFDYALIYGAFSFPQLGFNGAAYASVIAEFSGMAIVYLVIFNRGLKNRFNLFSDFSYDKKSSKSILKIAAPLVLQFAISLITWLVFFIVLENYGERAKAISNTMRNVFGILGVFVWAFASTSNIMVSNLIGQKLEHTVIGAIKKIMGLSLSATFVMLLLLNIFGESFFKMFGQNEAFVHDGIPVLRVISVAMLLMSMGTVWLNAVTGTGNTKMNLLIEFIAITMYLAYVYIVMIRLKLSLTVAWVNEFIYWAVILSIAFWYMNSGRWKNKIV